MSDGSAHRTLRVLLLEGRRGDAGLPPDLAVTSTVDVEIVRVATVAAAAELDLTSFDGAVLNLDLPDAKDTEAVEVLHARLPDLPLVAIWSGGPDPVTVVRSGADDVIDHTDATPERLLRSLLLAVERKVHERELRQESLTDPLTGLPNRRRFERALEDTERLLENSGGSALLLLLDLDRFKEINDTHGHPCGDKVLRSVAQRLGSQSRDRDLPFRLAGDEFGLLSWAPGRPDWGGAVERLRTTMRSFEIVLDGRRRIVTTTVGSAVADDAALVASLYERADLALYERKRTTSASPLASPG